MNNDNKYHVSLSFSGKDRAYVEAVASNLKQRGVKVFYDFYEQANLWGKNLYDHLTEIYLKKSYYVVMFISKHYKKNVWPNLERQAAQARAFTENKEYILPARFDDTEIPGMLGTVGYIDLNKTKSYELSDLICIKLQQEGIVEISNLLLQPYPGHVRWAPVDTGQPGINFLVNDSLPESFIPWFELEDEIRTKLLTQVIQVPEDYNLELNTFKGKPNWRIRIEKLGTIIGHIWFGPNPENGWKFDGFVRIGKPEGTEVWQTFQRYSNGTYIRL